MDIQQIQKVRNWLYNLGNRPDWIAMQVSAVNIQNIRNSLTRISHDIEKEYPIFSERLFQLKDGLFIEYGHFNPSYFGRVTEILDTILKDATSQSSTDIWRYIHPRISQVSKSLYVDKHYANAACDSFIEINARVKKLFMKLRPEEKVPDGDGVMKTVFSANAPMVEFCDRSTESGQNMQKGCMEMSAGAMSALRNPKAHENITITAEDAMRRLMFASLLMYKIDEAVVYSGINE